jgi:hypothetical protein
MLLNSGSDIWWVISYARDHIGVRNNVLSNVCHR